MRDGQVTVTVWLKHTMKNGLEKWLASWPKHQEHTHTLSHSVRSPGTLDAHALSEELHAPAAPALPPPARPTPRSQLQIPSRHHEEAFCTNTTRLFVRRPAAPKMAASPRRRVLETLLDVAGRASSSERSLAPSWALKPPPLAAMSLRLPFHYCSGYKNVGRSRGVHN